MMQFAAFLVGIGSGVLVGILIGVRWEQDDERKRQNRLRRLQHYWDEP